MTVGAHCVQADDQDDEAHLKSKTSPFRCSTGWLYCTCILSEFGTGTSSAILLTGYSPDPVLVKLD